MTLTEHEQEDVGTLDARLANLRTPAGYALGLETEAGVINVTATAAALRIPAPRDLDDLLQNRSGAQVRAVRAAAEQQRDAVVLVRSEEVAFAPVVTRPEKIICIGFNYQKHAEETGTETPKAPPLFAKFNNALNHHEGLVKLPADLDSHFDYETELVLVFGRECRDVEETDALDYLAGYAVGNDISARKLQTATTQFTAGKISDGFAPIGPWLVTRDRVPDPNDLTLKTHLNGEERQNWNTADMIYNCRKLIAFCSSIMTLKPGDVLFTGTPQGVIFGQKLPAVLRRWLKPGDEVVSSIEGLGELRVHLS